MKHFVLAILMSPLLVAAQNRGIFFEKNLSWQEVLQKAEKEHKYIFVDCYATWCGPCKWMDQHVYDDDTVGEFVNRAFIAVKLQMDTARQDDPEIQSSYAVAHMLGEQYRVQAYPSFLFISPEGRAVHKAVGAKNVADFLTLIKTARDPRSQYYTLRDAYYQGRMEYADLPALARAAKRLGEDSLSGVVAKDYLFNYLTKMHHEGIWRKEDLDFMQEYAWLLHYGDPLFHRYLSERRVIDSILGGSGKSDRLVNAVVYRDEVLPQVNNGIQNAREPNWRRIEKMIAKRYGSNYTANNLLKGRVEYYKARKEWANYAKYFVKQTEASNIQNWPSGIVNSYVLNNDAFEVFQYSFSKEDLEKALTWVDRSLSMNASNPQALDTKANLLYKLGRKDEGLVVEEQSLAMAPSDKGIEANYTKMKGGLPTWDEGGK